MGFLAAKVGRASLIPLPIGPECDPDLKTEPDARYQPDKRTFECQRSCIKRLKIFSGHEQTEYHECRNCGDTREHRRN